MLKNLYRWQSPRSGYPLVLAPGGCRSAECDEGLAELLQQIRCNYPVLGASSGCEEHTSQVDNALHRPASAPVRRANAVAAFRTSASVSLRSHSLSKALTLVGFGAKLPGCSSRMTPSVVRSSPLAVSATALDRTYMFWTTEAVCSSTPNKLGSQHIAIICFGSPG